MEVGKSLANSVGRNTEPSGTPLVTAPDMNRRNVEIVLLDSRSSKTVLSFNFNLRLKLIMM